MKSLSRTAQHTNGRVARWVLSLCLVVSLILPLASSARAAPDTDVADAVRATVSFKSIGAPIPLGYDDSTATAINCGSRNSASNTGYHTTTDLRRSFDIRCVDEVRWARLPSVSNTVLAGACYALALSHTGNGTNPSAAPANSTGCSAGQYVSGEVISFSGAVPASGWQVGSWSGTDVDTGMGSTNRLTMPASARSVAVNYGQITIGAWTPLFQGIDEANAQTTILSGSGNQVIRALRIDLENSNIRLFTTPAISNPQAGSRETAGSTTSEFLLDHGLQAAINANYFSPCCTQPSGSPFDVFGLAISEGNLVSAQEDAAYAASMVFTSANVPTMIPTNWPAIDTSGIHTAVTGKYPLVVQGNNVGSAGAVHPRTAIGYSQDKRYLILVTIDGRQPGYSDGAADVNTAEWMIRFGAYEAVNLDGGGSATMVVSNGLGGAQVLNRPIHNNVPGTERVVANHFGVFAKPICHTLTTTVAPAGGGSVSASPAPNCDSGAQYTLGTVVTLSASPTAGYAFAEWSGDASGTASPTTVIMNDAEAVTANFSQIAAPVVSITTSALKWSPVSDATAYRVYRSEQQPYFTPDSTPGSGNLAWEGPDTNYPIESVTTNYYIVRTVTNGGLSADSNRTGRFTITLTLGSAP